MPSPPAPLPEHAVLAVIPAFNEAASVGRVVAQVRERLGGAALVVSDASVDGTEAAARAAGAEVLSLTQQVGAWGATQCGLRFALAAGYPCVATLDADGQHDPASLAGLIAEFRASAADVVIGTFPQRLSAPKRLAWRWFRLLTGLAVEDLTSGLRVYGPRALAVLASDEATLLDYQDVGVLLLLRSHGLRVREVPVTMHARSDGRSRVFSSWFTVARYMAQTTLLCIARVGRLGAARSDGMTP